MSGTNCTFPGFNLSRYKLRKGTTIFNITKKNKRYKLRNGTTIFNITKKNKRASSGMEKRHAKNFVIKVSRDWFIIGKNAKQ